jgi:hypothetical protein
MLACLSSYSTKEGKIMNHRHKDLNAMLNRVIEKVADNIKQQSELSRSIGRKRLPRIGRIPNVNVTVYNPAKSVDLDDESEE